ncbi:NAD-dependent epimerase/dehydratase family protein [Vibrio mimicus]|uniref:NAD-dependent epimerase/dehydratase family protein n=1 Tax=Vibrio mimicus TaxID=674 RepID=UPI0011D8DC35|nr:NAD-dependent epimerase/dehydratase family protein [Vibrio mimicus]TXZ77081.1 NAD-dependent epimerase/dehydratase family protein [Vibrio mimicus]BCN22683.1 putative monosaccharide biosynthesis protein [Vibrio mimicus]
MKVHITGVNGFIGSWFKRSTTNNLVEVSREMLFANHQGALHATDCQDALINFAFDSCYQDNFKIVQACFKYAIANGIRKLIFLGSIVEYDRVNNNSVDENTSASLSRDIYTQEKLSISRFIEELASKYHALEIAIIQPTVVLGGGSWGVFIQRCLAHSQVILPSQNKICNYIHVDYLCETLDRLLQCESFGPQAVNRLIVTQSPKKTWEQVLSEYGVKYDHNDNCDHRFHRNSKINLVFKLWNETLLGCVFNRLVKIIFVVKKGRGGASTDELSQLDKPLFINGAARAEMMLDYRVDTSKLSSLVAGQCAVKAFDSTQKLKPTVIIIGSGIAGNILANRLVESYRVIMLDKGPRSGFAYDSQREESLSSVPTYCYGKGGSSHLWHNGLITFHRSNISDPEMVKLLSKTEPYLNEAANVLGYDETIPLDEAKKQLLASAKLPDLDAIYYPYHRRVVKLDNRVEFYGMVRNLESTLSECGQIKVLRFNSEGSQFELPTDKVVVSSGGLGTNSVINALGLSVPTRESFIDHPMGFVGKIKVKPEYQEDFAKLCIVPAENGYFKSGFTTKIGEHSAIFYVGSTCTMKNELSLYRYKSKLGASSGFSRVKQMFNLKMFNPDVVAVILNHLFGWQLSKSTYTLMAVFEQRESTNVINDKKAILNISENEFGLFNKHLAQVVDKLLPYTDCVNVESNLTAPWLWSAAHFSGSLREILPLLRDDLSLPSHSNVHICSPSIFTEHSYTNTGVEIAALAYYLSKVLNTEI